MKVVIVDDHEVSRLGIQAILESGGYRVIGSFSSPELALKFIKKTRPDFVIIDLKLNTQSGLEMGRKIKKKWPSIKTILLTGHFREVSFIPKIKTCFDGCVLKSEPAEDIIKALEIAKEGGLFISHFLKKTLAQTEREPITTREREVLRLMKEGLTVKEASKKIFLSPSTIKAHLRSIYKKLNVSNRAQAVSKAIEKGYLELE